jgi:hypothetical protein
MGTHGIDGALYFKYTEKNLIENFWGILFDLCAKFMSQKGCENRLRGSFQQIE